jgi:hypothetical protein
MKIKLLAALAISLLGLPTLGYGEPTARLAQISPTSEGESRLAGLVISMTPSEVVEAVGEPDSRQPKMDPTKGRTIQVWDYHKPFSLSLVMIDGRLTSISVGQDHQDRKPALIWNGINLPSLGASKSEFKSQLGAPTTVQAETDGDSWLYSLNPPGHVTPGKAARLKLYFRNGLVSAVLLGE